MNHKVLLIGWNFACAFTDYVNERAGSSNRFNDEFIVERQSHAKGVKTRAKVSRSCRNPNLNFSANLMGILTQFATLVCNARNLHELLHFRRLWVSGAGKGCQLNFR